jgi:hypothetical protein
VPLTALEAESKRADGQQGHRKMDACGKLLRSALERDEREMSPLDEEVV